jgi:hypothetical protein
LITANSGYAGGGILMSLGRAKVANNVIAGNSAVIGGGVVMLRGGQLANNTLVGNGAQLFAGNAYAGSDSSGQCLLTGNIIGNATTGGGLFFEEQDRLTQTTFNDVWNNVGGDYSEDANRTGVDGNISQDPQFVDATIGDFISGMFPPASTPGIPVFNRARTKLISMAAPACMPGGLISAPQSIRTISGLWLTPDPIESLPQRICRIQSRWMGAAHRIQTAPR